MWIVIVYGVNHNNSQNYKPENLSHTHTHALISVYTSAHRHHVLGQPHIGRYNAIECIRIVIT